MNQFQVIRPFSGYEVGAILRDADFVNQQRATQLVDLRFLTQLGGETAGVQPTANALNEATIRQLSQLLTEVVDSGVIAAALGEETRESAIKAMEKRLAEMENTSD